MRRCLANRTSACSCSRFAGQATADYTLRVDERGNPVWIIALQRQGGEPAGTVHVGANHGTITRTEGLFSGGDRAAVVDEQSDLNDNAPADEDDDGDQNIVKRRIKQAFHQVRDDVKRSFYKVRKSFVDFVREH